MNALRATAVCSLVTGLTGLLLSSCSADPDDPDDALGQARQRTIYGGIDIHEPFDYPDSAFAARAAEFTVSVFDASALDESNPNEVRHRADWTVTTRLQATTGKPLCEGEPFATQPALSACSGVLIADDLVLTAGHCTNGCSTDLRFVFDYALTPGGSLQTLTSDDVYRCDSAIADHDDSTGLDYAIVHLNRPVVNRTPAPVRASSDPLAAGTGLIMTGHPWRMPLKITDNAAVRGDTPNGTRFVANLDAIQGNSGSGVFDATSHELLGILVRGDADFVSDETCHSWNRCPDDGCRGEDVVYVHHAIEEACAQIDAPFCDP
ncbi:MAG TPA: serine protease [Polyangiaceae bacterium]|nr:serine protease [Polyangiaceae bacterium]